MFTQFTTTVQRLISLNDNEMKILCDSFELRKVPAQTLLLDGGEIAEEVYFINKGSIQSTNSMFTVNQFAGIFDSFVQHAPSTQQLATVEDCELLVISSERLMRLYNEIPKIPLLIGKIAEDYFKNNTSYE